MFIAELMKKFKEHRQDAEHMLLNDAIEDFASYRYMTGKIRGIDDAIEITREMCRKAGNDEDDDEL
jgi:hypothetical protein